MTDAQPLVSIITPSYNRAHFIRLCMESVRKQTYKNLEHIIIDGGSQDSTIDVLKRYEGLYNMHWISEPDEGMYHAINKGLQMARGSILAYLNTDDAYFPWTVEVIVRYLVQTNAKIVFGDLLLVKAYKDAKSVTVQFYRPFDIKYYAHFAAIGQPTVFLRREVFEGAGRFDTSYYKYLGDCEFWLRCASLGLLPQKIDEVLALQVDHEGTLRDSQRTLLEQEFLRLWQTYGSLEYRQRHYWKERFKDKLIWRKTMTVFLWNYLLGTSRRWPCFLRFLRENGLRVDVWNWLILMSVPYVIRRRFKVEMIAWEQLFRALDIEVPICTLLK